MQRFKAAIKKSCRLHLAIIVAVCIIAYLPILRNTFSYDDPRFFTQWETPKSFTNAQKFIEGDAPPGHEGVYRPLRTVIYAVDYKLWGENPVGYHAQAIVTNAAIAAVVYLIAAYMTGNPFTGFIAGLLFGLHPAHTEAVTFTTASMDTVGILMAYASFYLFITTKKAGTKRFYASLVLGIAAFFIYEVTLITPALMFVYRLLFKPKQTLKHRETVSWSPLMWFAGGAAYYLGMRLTLMTKAASTATYVGGDFWKTLSLTAKFFYQYVQILVFPFGLSLYHQVAPGLNSFYTSTKALKAAPVVDVHTFLSISIIVVSVWAAFTTYRRKPIIAFGIIWFYVSMLPTLNLLPTHNVFAERYAYFASFGFILIVAVGIAHLKKYSYLALIGLALVYMTGTIMRNNDWTDSRALWSQIARHAPHSPVGWNGLGLVEDDAGNKEQAATYYKRAISHDDTYAQAHSNIAGYYYDKKDYDTAISHLQTAVSLDPKNKDYATNLVKARDALAESIPVPLEVKKQREDIAAVLSEARGRATTLNDTAGAITIIEDALKRYPSDARLLNDVGVLYMSRGDNKKSIEYLLQASKIIQSDPDIYLNLAHAFLQNGEKRRAAAALRLAIQLKPDFEVAKELLKKTE